MGVRFSHQENFDVIIVGGGTAGLSVGRKLKENGVKNVLILEREEKAGGVPRHCGHYPFGLREYKSLLKGPQYAAKNVEMALQAGVKIATGVSVTKLLENGGLNVSTMAGEFTINAKRVVLATGVRESSRAQRFISGSRPMGVMTTGALQAMVYLEKLKPFSNPIILGSELVSFSAIKTCQHLGIRPKAMVEENSKVIAREILKPYLLLKNVPLYVGAKSLKILGDKTVEALTFLDENNSPQKIETDGIIVSGHFRPEAALLYQSHLKIDAATDGPLVDQFGRCSDPNYYCVGNLLRAAETSSWCWHEAREMADRISASLETKTQKENFVDFEILDQRLKYIVPQRLSVSSNSKGVKNLRIALSQDFKGEIFAHDDFKNLLWHSPLNSKPIRRIDLPIKALQNALKGNATKSIHFSLSKD